MGQLFLRLGCQSAAERDRSKTDQVCQVEARQCRYPFRQKNFFLVLLRQRISAGGNKIINISSNNNKTDRGRRGSGTPTGGHSVSVFALHFSTYLGLPLVKLRFYATLSDYEQVCVLGSYYTTYAATVTATTAVE